MASDVRRCNCKDEYQDEQYGKQMRVTTPKANGGRRCTKCGKDI